LLIRSFIALNHVSAGFDDRNLLTFDLSLSSKNMRKRRRFAGSLINSWKRSPRCRHRVRCNHRSAATGGGDSENQFYVTNRPKPSPSELPLAMNYIVTPGYLKAMNIPCCKGDSLRRAIRCLQYP